MDSTLPSDMDVCTTASRLLDQDWDGVATALDGCILSASGWRKIFTPDRDEENNGFQVHHLDYALAAFMAEAFLDQLFPTGLPAGSLIALGTDSRPTGGLLAESMLRACLARGVAVACCGVVAAPQIMAWARLDAQVAGFIYVSASHNPIGHNGVKFGLKTGGVLTGSQVKPLIASLKAAVSRPQAGNQLRQRLAAVSSQAVSAHLQARTELLQRSGAAYLAHTREVLSGSSDPAVQEQTLQDLKASLARHPLGIVVDYNGSARCTSIDRDFLGSLGVRFHGINGVTGAVAHRIVPEGESLEYCRVELERLWQQDKSCVLGYMPDNDGDRGNLVCIQAATGKAVILEAQEVFALACLSELGHAALSASQAAAGPGLAVAVNDPTSMRVEDIAAVFGATVFRAEVGEANVVQLAVEKRQAGWQVPILGEGSNGGSIVHPSAVRDPLNTVLGMIRLLSAREAGRSPYGLWCSRRGLPFQADFGLEDIVASLPAYTTTSVYEDRALMQITTLDHGRLKAAYEQVFLEEWEANKAMLASRFGIQGWECLNHEGTVVRPGMGKANRTGEERGGFKILFTDGAGRARGYLWMRGSGTEPVFRILVDLAGQDAAGEQLLLDWHRRMVSRADSLCRSGLV